MLLALLLAAWAVYRRRLRGGWRGAFIAGATAALHFNAFVGVVQVFQNVPSLAALAPTQTEVAFIVTQLVLLAVFVALGRLVWRS